MECVKKKNMESCNCTSEGCAYKGMCCACVKHHVGRGEFPACFFTDEGVATRDRSFEMLLKDRGVK